jgi:DNA-binding MarR family transcriptional regulator
LLTQSAGRKDARVIEASGRDDEAVAQFVERFALQWAEAGFPRMAARVFIALLVSDSGQRTVKELTTQLRVSPAAVSGAVRYLGQIGLVVRGRNRCERRDHYMISDDMWFEMFARRDEMLLRFERDLEEGVKALGADTPAGARLAETREFFEFVRMEFPGIMERWRASRAVR